MALPQKRFHVPPPAGLGPLPFSSGVLVGDTFYLAGHIGFDPERRAVPAELEREVRLLLDGVRDTLAKANLTMNDLVFVQVFCPNVSLFDEFNVIYRTYFGDRFPARAFIGSGPLVLGAHFEVQGIAVRE